MTVTGKIRKVQMREETAEARLVGTATARRSAPVPTRLTGGLWLGWSRPDPLGRTPRERRPRARWPTTTGRRCCTSSRPGGTCSVTTPTSGASRSAAARRSRASRPPCATSSRRAEDVDPPASTSRTRLTRDVVIASRDGRRRPDRDPAHRPRRQPGQRAAGAARAGARAAVGARRAVAGADAGQARRGRRPPPPARRAGARTRADGWVGLAGVRGRARPSSSWSGARRPGRLRPGRGGGPDARRCRCRRAPGRAARGGRALGPARAEASSVTRCAASSPEARPEEPLRPLLARRRRRGVRRGAALLHDHREVRPGDPRDRARAGGQARRRVPRSRSRGGRHATTSSRSSTRCGPTRSCTSSTPTSWSSSRRSRWRVPRARWATGSRSCRRRRAPSRARRSAPRRSTSRPPPTALVAARSSSTPSIASAWGRFELEAMAFHEGVPGHHLQLAIAAELPDSIPAFRKPPQQLGVLRGLGALHRAPLRRDGAVLHRARPDGHVQRRLDARLPARRRHRPPCPGLEPAAGDRLHGRELTR